MPPHSNELTSEMGSGESDERRVLIVNLSAPKKENPTYTACLY